MESCWELAFQRLDAQSRQKLQDVSSASPSSLSAKLDDVLLEVQRQKNLRELKQKRWKLSKPNGEQVILREVFERIVKSIVKLRGVGDVLIQADPLHAGLPWAGVRLILTLLASNYEQSASMAEAVQRIVDWAADYTIIENLYLNPSTNNATQKPLREAIIDLYHPILLLLLDVVAFYRSSTIRRLAEALTASDDLENAVRNISSKQQRVDLLISAIEHEMQMGISHRIEALQSLSLKVHERDMEELRGRMERITMHLDDQEREELLSWISTTPFRNEYIEAKRDLLPQSGAWLLEHSSFKDWKASCSSSILWLHGIPGSGKTKLTTVVISGLLERSNMSIRDAAVAYFHCSAETAQRALGRADPLHVLRSILKQLCASNLDGSIPKFVASKFNNLKQMARSAGSDIEQLNMNTTIECILNFLQDRSAFIVIDALDECDGSTRYELFEALQRIVYDSESVVKIFVSSRDDVDITDSFQDFAQISISSSDNGVDIDRFISTQLDESIKRRRILRGKVSASLKEHIYQTLVGGAQGMFRWVSLQIERLCSRDIKVEDDAREALKSLPHTLTGSYRTIVEEIKSGPSTSRALAFAMFSWLVGAKEVISASTFGLICSIHAGISDEHCEADNLLDVCRNLVTFGGVTNQNFKFAHLSVREYLIQNEPEMSVQSVNENILDICTQLLIDGNQRKTISEKWDKPIAFCELYKYIVCAWPWHYSVLENKSCFRSQVQLNEFLVDEAKFSRWFENRIIDTQQRDWLDERDLDTSRLFMIKDVTPSSFLLLVSYGFLDLLKSCADALLKQSGARSKEGMDAMHIIALRPSTEGDEKVEMAAFLRDHGVSMDSCDIYGRTPLHLVVKADEYLGDRVDDSLLGFLLRNGANVNAVDRWERNPLVYASVAGNRRQICKTLLLHGADAGLCDNLGQSAWYIALADPALYEEWMNEYDMQPNKQLPGPAGHSLGWWIEYMHSARQYSSLWRNADEKTMSLYASDSIIDRSGFPEPSVVPEFISELCFPDEVWITAVHPRKDQVAIGCRDGQLALCRYDTSAPMLETLANHREQSHIRVLAWHPHGTFLAYAFGKGFGILNESFESVFYRSNMYEGPFSVFWSPDGSIFAATSTESDQHINFWACQGQTMRSLNESFKIATTNLSNRLERGIIVDACFIDSDDDHPCRLLFQLNTGYLGVLNLTDGMITLTRDHMYLLVVQQNNPTIRRHGFTYFLHFADGPVLSFEVVGLRIELKKAYLSTPDLTAVFVSRGCLAGLDGELLLSPAENPIRGVSIWDTNTTELLNLFEAHGGYNVNDVCRTKSDPAYIFTAGDDGGDFDLRDLSNLYRGSRKLEEKMKHDMASTPEIHEAMYSAFWSIVVCVELRKSLRWDMKSKSHSIE